MRIQHSAAALGALAICLLVVSGCGATGQTGAAPSGPSSAPTQRATATPAAAPTVVPATPSTAGASPSPSAPIGSVTTQGEPTPAITQPGPSGTTAPGEPPMPLPPVLAGTPGPSTTGSFSSSGSGVVLGGGTKPGPFGQGVQLTQADDGKTIQTRVGQTIYLALTAPQGFANWDVAPPDGAVLVGVPNPAAAAVRNATLRAFRAAAAGHADITATSKPDCQPGQVCAQVIRLYRVTVTVSA